LIEIFPISPLNLFFLFFCKQRGQDIVFVAEVQPFLDKSYPPKELF